MPEISKIVIPGSAVPYDIKDTTARNMAAGGIQLKGTTTTALTDECTTNPITIGGESYTAVNQDAVFYGKKEFVFDGTKWHEFGDMSGLGDLATKDSVTGTTSYTPAGTVSQPTFTQSSGTCSITTVSESSSGKYQPKGTVSKPTFSGNSLTSTGTYTPAGSVAAPTISVSSAGSTTTVNSITAVGSLPTFTVADEVLTITAGTLPTKGANTTVKTGDASYTATAPTFTGTEATISVSGTPSGTVSQPTFTGTKVNLTGSATVAGTVSKPTFSGTAATISITST